MWILNIDIVSANLTYKRSNYLPYMTTLVMSECRVQYLTSLRVCNAFAQAVGLYLISAVSSGTLIRRVSVCRTTVRSARCVSRGFPTTTPSSITAKLPGWGVSPRRAAIRPESGSVWPVWESPGRRGKPAAPRPVQRRWRAPKSSCSRACCWIRRSEVWSLHFG